MKILLKFLLSVYIAESYYLNTRLLSTNEIKMGSVVENDMVREKPRLLNWDGLPESDLWLRSKAVPIKIWEKDL